MILRGDFVSVNVSLELEIVTPEKDAGMWVSVCYEKSA